MKYSKLAIFTTISLALVAIINFVDKPEEKNNRIPASTGIQSCLSSVSSFQTQSPWKQKYQDLFAEIIPKLQKNIALPEATKTKAIDLVSSLSRDEVLEDPILHEFLITQAMDLYLKSSNLEDSLNFFEEIGLTKLLTSITYRNIQHPTGGKYHRVLNALPLPTKASEVPYQEEDLTGQVLYHATPSYEVWKSIRSRADGNLNAIMSKVGPGTGFYFTSKAPKKQYGDYVIAFKIGPESSLIKGDKPTEYILTVAKDAQIVDYKDPLSDYADYSLEKFIDLFPSSNLKMKKSVTSKQFLERLASEFSNLSKQSKREKFEKVLKRVDHENVDNVFKTLSTLATDLESREILVEEVLKHTPANGKVLPFYIDVEGIAIDKIKELPDRWFTGLSNQKDRPRLVVNPHYWHKELSEFIDYKNIKESHSLHFPEFIKEVSEKMSKEERFQFALELVDIAANRVSSVFLGTPYYLDNADYIKLIETFIEKGKDFHLSLDVAHNPQSWANIDITKTILQSQDASSYLRNLQEQPITQKHRNFIQSLSE